MGLSYVVEVADTVIIKMLETTQMPSIIVLLKYFYIYLKQEYQLSYVTQ